MQEEDEEEIPCLIEVPFDTNKVVPVTILSGFLGSGKSTLLNYILTANHGKRIAVIENEFSQGLGVESMIAKSGVNGDNITNFFELNNGCICCTVKDDLLRTLEQLVLHKDRFDYVLIETTGMANPGPVITSFWSDQNLGSCLMLDGVVCVIDSANILTYLSSSDVAFEVKQQICYADRILINKCDLANAEQIGEVKKAVRSINCIADMQESTFAKVALDFILSTGSYAENNPSSLVQCMPCLPPPPSHSKGRAVVTSTAFRLDAALDLHKTRVLLDFLLYANGDEGIATAVPEALTKLIPALSSVSLPPTMKIYRMKGVLHVVGEQRLFVLQAVHNLFELEESLYEIGCSEDRSEGKSLVVIIGTGLDEELLERLFVGCT